MTSSGSTEIESKIRQLSLWLEGRLLDWEVTYTNGSQDFTVNTGVRLNNLRSQILLLRRDIRLLCDANHLNYPEAVYERIPPPVADTYTVKQDMGFHHEIRYECVSEA